jgi:hypothetical protein
MQLLKMAYGNHSLNKDLDLKMPMLNKVIEVGILNVIISIGDQEKCSQMKCFVLQSNHLVKV